MSGNKKLTTTLIMALMLSVPAACGSEKITFKFRPPDNTRFSQAMMGAKTITYQTGQNQTDSTRAEVSVQLDKAESGYKMVVTPVIMKMYRDDKPIAAFN